MTVGRRESRRTAARPFLFCDIRFRWRAHRIKPSADIDSGVGFPTEVTGSRCASRCGLPFEHWKFCVAAPDHEPVIRAAGDVTTDFESELLERAHQLMRFPSPHCHGALLQGKIVRQEPQGSVEHKQLQ